MRSTTLRPLLLVPPVVPLLALAAGFLNGTAAYVVGGAIIALYTLLCLPLTLSRVTWKTQEAEEAKGLVPAGHFWR